MKKLPPAKRNHLILVIMVTLAMIGMVYYFLITPQKQENDKLATDIANNAAKLEQIKKTIQQADANAKAAQDIADQLNLAETDIASGDMFAWTYDTIRRFKAGYKIDVPNIGQPVPGEVDLIAEFPYKQIKFTLSGTGYYHDLGKFVSDLENKFPHIRVLNLSLEPVGELSPEKIGFRMEIAALVKAST
jgi:Tfp pilus assembly protein PilO